MAVYRFRVWMEDDEEVFRDIDIRSVQKFSHLHDAVLEAFRFDKKHSASFFISNDNWHKGKEITSDSSRKGVAKMKDSVLKNFIEDPHQKFIFIYDFEKEWSFMVELQKINTTEDNNISYPFCSKKSGVAPKQYKTMNKKVVEDDEEVVPDKERFHEETFLYEEEEMEKDVEALNEDIESSGLDGEQQSGDYSSLDSEEN